MSNGRKEVLNKARQHAMEVVENWDADFDVEPEVAFLQSSVSSCANSDRELSSYTPSTRSANYQGSFYGDDDVFGDEFRDANLSSNLSNLRLESPIKRQNRMLASKPSTIGTVKQKDSTMIGAFGEDSNIHSEFTVRMKKQSDKDSNNLIAGTFFEPYHADKAEPKLEDDDEHFEDEFDLQSLDVDLNTRLKRVNQQRNLNKHIDDDNVMDSWGEESRSQSRMSEASSSVFSTAPSTTLDESEIEGEDFLEGLHIPAKYVDFQSILKAKQIDAQRVADREDELLQRGKKYETIRSNGSGNSVNDIPAGLIEEDDIDVDFFDGIEMEKSDLIEHYKDIINTVHRNIVVKSSGSRKARKTTSMQTELAGAHRLSKTAQSTMNLSPRTRQVSGTQSTNLLKLKKSMPSLHRIQYRDDQSHLPSLNIPKKFGKTQEPGDSILLSPPDLIQPPFLAGSPSSTHKSHHVSAITRRKLSGEHANHENVSGGSPIMKSRVASSSSIRPVQSMMNIVTNQPRHLQSPSKKRMSHDQPPDIASKTRFSKGRNRRVYGDGTELELLDDLPTSYDKEKNFTVTPRSRNKLLSDIATIERKPLDEYTEKPVKCKSIKSKASPLKDKSANLTHRRRKPDKNGGGNGPGLIQQLGPPTSIVVKGYHGDMYFNPSKLIWEGNDVELKKFDTLNTKTPGLIAYISNKGAVQVVGDMMFDPEKLCWVNVKEDDDDPFAGVEDLDVSVSSKAAKTNSVYSSVSRVGSMAGEFTVGTEFEISSAFIKKLEHEDTRWQRKTKEWISTNDDVYDREYLNEIRKMVMNK